MHPEISIIIPVKNGEDTIGDCLKGIVTQSIFHKCEIIIIDSGSTDSTLEILENFPVIIYKIDPELFNHGLTRDFGVVKSKGRFIVMTVQDAISGSADWLKTMYNHFKDPDIAGVCGKQLVSSNKFNNPHDWSRPINKPTVTKVQFKSKVEFENLSPKELWSLSRWDNVNSMYRKSMLIKFPFGPSIFGEDMLWAKNVLHNGHKLVYDNNSQVAHYHHHSPSYTYKRILITWLFIYKNFGYLREDPFSYYDYIMVVYRNIKWKANIKWIWHNWNSIWHKKRAIRDFYLAYRNNNLDQIEINLKTNVPQGRSK